MLNPLQVDVQRHPQPVTLHTPDHQHSPSFMLIRVSREHTRAPHPDLSAIDDQDGASLHHVRHNLKAALPVQGQAREVGQEGAGG
ncbi:hypothetical protein FCS05_20080, partial [Deinococcus metallilatus]